MKLIKHVGKLKDRDTRVLVVFMQLPEDPTSSLVVETHTLPDLLQDEIIRLIETDECQRENDLGTFLNRKTLTNGGGGSILNFLHTAGKLKKVAVKDVIMVPHPGHPIALSELLAMMKGSTTPVAEVKTSMVTAKTTTAEERVAIAQNLLIEAEMLREDAAKKEKQAHDMMPEACFAEKPAKKTRAKKAKTEV